MIRKSHRLQRLVTASAVAFLLGTSSSHVLALALGKVSVLSALGEPLRAEIEVPEVSPEEAASLRAGPATPEAFKAAGLDYNSIVNSIQVSLQKRADGRSYLRLTSERAINDPFIDLILEANWSSGRIVRDYTMLFDPPGLRVQPAPVPSAPQISPPPATRAVPPPVAVAPPASRPAAPPVVVASPPAAKPETVRKPAPPAPAPAARVGDARQVTVVTGDTAAKIALGAKPANLSLDQMLVALLRANPDAFVAGNVNRLKAGAVLDLPDADAAGQVPAAEARQTIIAQSRDFNEFRRKLAQSAPAAQVAAAERQVSGSINAQVQDKRAATAAPDKLTLSKSGSQAAANEAQIAKDRQAKEAAARTAELSKNIQELAKISAAASSATPAAANASTTKGGIAVAVSPVTAASAIKPAVAVATPASAVAAAVPVPATAPASAPTAITPVTARAAQASATTSLVAPASATASAVAPAALPASVAPAAPAVVSAASVPPKPKPIPVPPPPPPEASLLDDLLENPLLPVGALALVALLGFGVYRSRKQKNTGQIDSSFLESRLQPDSFFGASGGQRVDTSESSATGSSMVYSPSQLDAAGDVDPVAEADVYLAYGRDLQAEEILKEALRSNPTRAAIHGKLLQIYAKRGDAKSFAQVANDAYKLTQGQGADWNQICMLGNEIDPGNPLYQPGGDPVGSGADPAYNGATQSFAASTSAQPLEPAYAGPSGNVDLDLDLDFSIGDDATDHVATQAVSTTPALFEPALAMAGQMDEPPTLDIDFGNDSMDLTAAAAPVQLSVPDLAMSDNGLTFTPDPAPVSHAPVATQAPIPANDDFGMMEFDLGALSLDLGGGTELPTAAPTLTTAALTTPAPAEIEEDNPLATKLALAEEFNAIGDPDGARSLVEEVVAEATGPLKEKAQRFLAEIS